MMDIFIQWVVIGSGFTLGAIITIYVLGKIHSTIYYVRKLGLKYTLKHKLWRE